MAPDRNPMPHRFQNCCEFRPVLSIPYLEFSARLSEHRGRESCGNAKVCFGGVVRLEGWLGTPTLVVRWNHGFGKKMPAKSRGQTGYRAKSRNYAFDIPMTAVYGVLPPRMNAAMYPSVNHATQRYRGICAIRRMTREVLSAFNHWARSPMKPIAIPMTGSSNGQLTNDFQSRITNIARPK
jgi:hypothetical protein